MRYEAAAVDPRELAEKFDQAPQRAGFDFEHPTLAAALDGYEAWLRQPVRGLEWGESDCAIVAVEPLLAAGGAFAIELRGHVGEPNGSEPAVDLQLVFLPDLTPGVRGLWGTVVEALDEPPALGSPVSCATSLRSHRGSRTIDRSRRCCASTASVCGPEGSSFPPDRHWPPPSRSPAVAAPRFQGSELRIGPAREDETTPVTVVRSGQRRHGDEEELP
jgi:hypothetical protein